VRGVIEVPRKKRTGKYKIKTQKATSKRFRLTGTGKLEIGRGPNLKEIKIAYQRILGANN